MCCDQIKIIWVLSKQINYGKLKLLLYAMHERVSICILFFYQTTDLITLCRNCIIMTNCQWQLVSDEYILYKLYDNLNSTFCFSLLMPFPLAPTHINLNLYVHIEMSCQECLKTISILQVYN
jgi:hypothetical protein